MGDPGVPGPIYNYQNSNKVTKGIKFGTSTRPGLYGRSSARSTMYNKPKDNLESSFDDEKRDKASTLGGPAFSMGVKVVPKKNQEKLPGPGEYDAFATPYLEKNTGAVIGTSVRPDLNRNEKTPGPGNYRLNVKDVGPKWRFATSKKASQMKPNDEPGPGSYNLPSAFGNAPKYLLPKDNKADSRFF